MLFERLVGRVSALSCCVERVPAALAWGSPLSLVVIHTPGGGSEMWSGAYLVSTLLVAASAATLPSTGTEPDGSPITTTEEPEPTGDKWFGDKCENTSECAFKGSICDKHSCVCRPDLPATNHYDKCGPEVEINGTCFFNAQCEMRTRQTECKDSRCTCMFEMKPVINKQNQVECIADYVTPEPERYVDPTMIGVLVGMALMFLIICVVLRLFAKARWRENRTIFNTPNPRLMNVSLLRETKPGTGERRGSRGSTNKPPSRQPSLASLRPTSPAQSQGSRISPRGSLRGSRSSSGSAKSPTKGAAHLDSRNTAQA